MRMFALIGLELWFHNNSYSLGHYCLIHAGSSEPRAEQRAEHLPTYVTVNREQQLCRSYSRQWGTLSGGTWKIQSRGRNTGMHT